MQNASRINDINSIFPAEQDVPLEIKFDFPVIQHEWLVNGQLRQWEGELQTVISPICVISEDGQIHRQELGVYPLLSRNEAKEALDAAVAAYDNGRGAWPMMPVEMRIQCVQNFVIAMKAVRSDVIKWIMWEIGKTTEDAEKEFDRTVDYINDTIEALKDVDRVSSRFDIQQGMIAQIRRSPLGVVMCMGPFNYPLNETFTTLIPALIMGNTVIFKPAKFGVLLHNPLLETYRDAFPPGVINIVYGNGSELMPPIMESGNIACLAFIGSSRVADVLKKQHPMPHRLRSCLGLEAKNPAIILPDADLDVAVNECLLGTLSYNGQRCTALKLLFIHADIADEFLASFCGEVEKLSIGMPWEPCVKITPLPEDDKAEYLTGLVEDAKAKGASVMNPSGGLINNTFFFPTVLYPVTQDMRVFSEEQFGPVIPIVPFSNIEEPIEAIIDSKYGSQCSIFGTNVDEIAKLVDMLVNQVCRVNINSQCQRSPDKFPFTGRKDSAELTLSVSDALRVFSIRTLVAMKGSELNKELLTDILKNRRSTFLNMDFIF